MSRCRRSWTVQWLVETLTGEVQRIGKQEKRREVWEEALELDADAWSFNRFEKEFEGVRDVFELQV